MDCLNRLGFDVETKIKPTSKQTGQLTLISF